MPKVCFMIWSCESFTALLMTNLNTKTIVVVTIFSNSNVDTSVALLIWSYFLLERSVFLLKNQPAWYITIVSMKLASRHYIMTSVRSLFCLIKMQTIVFFQIGVLLFFNFPSLIWLSRHNHVYRLLDWNTKQRRLATF